MKLICTESEFKDLILKKLVVPLEGGKCKLITRNLLDEDYSFDLEINNNLDEIKKGVQSKLTIEVTEAEVEEWIDEYRSEWTGLRKNGVGSKKDCVTKMVKFLNDNPQFNKEIVLEARNEYIKSMNGDYTLLEQADYFISKRIRDIENNGYRYRSTLQNYCEEVLLKKNYEKNEDLGLGNTIELM